MYSNKREREEKGREGTQTFKYPDLEAGVEILPRLSKVPRSIHNQCRYLAWSEKSADFLVTRFCIIGDVTVSGLGDMGLLVDCCVWCVRSRERNLETKVETIK